MQTRIKNECGFTLVELIVVIAIVGILATFAVMGTAVIRKETVTSRTKEIFADLQKARADAMAGGTSSTDVIPRNIHGVGIQLTSPTTYVIFRFNDVLPMAALITASGDYQYNGAAEQLIIQTVTLSSVELRVLNGAVLTPPAATPNDTIIFDRFGYPRQTNWTLITNMIIAVRNPNLAGFTRCISIQTNSIREGFYNVATSTCTQQ
jgi:prepilin-type N-terminal cleavage/methylation domain-containing protein